MEPPSIWKDLSANIHKVFEPVVGVKTKDLLVEVPEPAADRGTPMPFRERVSIRSSSLNSTYQNYNPVYSTAMRNRHKYQPMEHRMRRPQDGVPLSVSPRLFERKAQSYFKETPAPSLIQQQLAVCVIQ